MVKLHNLAVVEDDVGAVVAHRGPGQLAGQGQVGDDGRCVGLGVEALHRRGV